MNAARLTKLVPAADQAVSSASNIFLAVSVGQVASPDDFGRFAIATSVYWLCLGGLRALVGENLLIRREGLVESIPRVDSAYLYWTLVVASLLAVVIALVSMASGETVLLVVAISMPALLAQDAYRYVAFARRMPIRALESDGAWLVLQGLTTTALFSYGSPTVAELLAVWAVASLAAALLLAARLAVVPSRQDAQETRLRTKKTAWHLLGDFALGSGGQQMIVFALPWLLGLAALGGVKAAQVALGPFNMLVAASAVVVVPAVAAAERSGQIGRSVSTTAYAAAALGALGLVYTAAIGVLPDNAGAAAFGASWQSARGVVVPLGIAMTLTAVCACAGMYLKGTGETSKGLRTRAIYTPIGVLLPLCGAAATGVGGFAWGLVASSAVACTLWYRTAAAVRDARGARSVAPSSSSL